MDLKESRAVSTNSAQAIATDHGADFAEVSAKTGEGIEEVKQLMISRLSVCVCNVFVYQCYISNCRHSEDLLKSLVH